MEKAGIYFRMGTGPLFPAGAGFAGMTKCWGDICQMRQLCVCRPLQFDRRCLGNNFLKSVLEGGSAGNVTHRKSAERA